MEKGDGGGCDVMGNGRGVIRKSEGLYWGMEGGHRAQLDAARANDPI